MTIQFYFKIEPYNQKIIKKLENSRDLFRIKMSSNKLTFEQNSNLKKPSQEDYRKLCREDVVIIYLTKFF